MNSTLTFVISFLIFIEANYYTSKPVGVWRSAWTINLSADYNDFKFPTIFKICLKNNTDKTLKGKYLFLNIYTEDSFSGCAYLEDNREKEIKLCSKEEIDINLPFNKLNFRDIHGKNVYWETLYEYLSKEKWTVKVTISDIISQKPLEESSFLVYSNLLEIDPVLDIR